MIRNQPDFWSGVMFIALGVFFAWYASASYQMGTAARMGPAFFPFWLGVLLTIIGAIVCLGALRSAHRTPLPGMDWDIVLIVLGSIVGFAVMLEPLGFYLSLVVLIIASSAASHEFNWKVAIGNALFLLLFAYLVFIRGLQLVLPLYPMGIKDWSLWQLIVVPLYLLVVAVLLLAKHRFTQCQLAQGQPDDSGEDAQRGEAARQDNAQQQVEV